MMTYSTPEWRDWVLTEDQSRPFIKRAVELGINFFMISLCLDQGIGVIPWSSLVRGFLTGSRTREEHKPTTRSVSD